MADERMPIKTGFALSCQSGRGPLQRAESSHSFAVRHESRIVSPRGYANCALNALSLHVFKHSLECFEIAVDVSKNPEFHYDIFARVGWKVMRCQCYEIAF